MIVCLTLGIDTLIAERQNQLTDGTTLPQEEFAKSK
jgi:hypothetical protein